MAFLSKLWKTIYKQPVKRLQEERLLKRRLELVNNLKKEKKTEEILIIRTDDIGDYILFRNTLELVKQKWPDNKVTLLGHSLWKPIAENWDKDFAHEFIWLDKGRFMKDENYAKEFLSSISGKHPAVVIAPSYSRNPFIDNIIAGLFSASEKYAWQRNTVERKKWLRKYVDTPYTQTFPIPKGLHEFDLNTRFMEQVTGQKSSINKPFIPAEKLPVINKLPHNYAVLFPGAAAKRKRWDTANFARMADYLSSTYQLYSIICGSKGDAGLADEIIKLCKNPKAIINYTGKTDLLQLGTLLNGCKLIITNDTSAAHYAAALNKNTIALLNGNSYGRFFPYPADLHPNVYSIYPPGIKNIPYDWVDMGDINKITAEMVMEKVGEVLNRI